MASMLEPHDFAPVEYVIDRVGEEKSTFRGYHGSVQGELAPTGRHGEPVDGLRAESRTGSWSGARRYRFLYGRR